MPFHGAQLGFEERDLALLTADLRAFEILVEDEDGHEGHTGEHQATPEDPADIVAGRERDHLRAELGLVEPDVVFFHLRKIQRKSTGKSLLAQPQTRG